MASKEIVEYRNFYAIGIILVVSGHWYSRSIDLHPFFNLLKDIIYSFHMPIFFIGSGILSQGYLKKRPLFRTLKKTSMYFMLLWAISSSFSLMTDGNIENILNPWSWQLSFAWFLLVFSGVKIIDYLGLLEKKIVELSILLISFLFIIQTQNSTLFLVGRCVHWWVLGRFLRRYAFDLRDRQTLYLLGSYGFLCLCIFGIKYSAGIGIAVVAMFSKLIVSGNLLLIGRHTLQIYLVHLFIIYLIKLVLPLKIILWIFLPFSYLICLLISKCMLYFNRYVKN